MNDELKKVYESYPELEKMELKDVTKMFLACSIAGDKEFAKACHTIIKNSKGNLSD